MMGIERAGEGLKSAKKRRKSAKKLATQSAQQFRGWRRRHHYFEHGRVGGR